MTHYFISYARSDGFEIADELTNRFRAIGHDVFIDVQGIPGGSQWEIELIRQARWADALLILVTPASNESKFVYNEFREAEKNHKWIVPIIVNNTPLPEHLQRYNGLPLGNPPYDSLLLKLERSKPGWVGRKQTPRALYLVAALMIIAIVAVVLLVLNRTGSTQIPPTEQPKVAVAATEVAATTAPTVAFTDTAVPTVTSPATTSTLSATNAVSRTSPTPAPPEAILLNEDFSRTLTPKLNIPPDANILADETGNPVLDVKSLGGEAFVNFLGFAPKNIAVEYRIKILDVGNGDGPCVDLNFDYKGTDTFVFRLALDYSRSSIFFFKPGSTWQALSNHDINFQKNVWYHVRLEMQNSQIKAYIDDELVNQATDSRLIDGSRENLIVKLARVQLDDIKVTDLGETPSTAFTDTSVPTATSPAAANNMSATNAVSRTSPTSAPPQAILLNEDFSGTLTPKLKMPPDNNIVADETGNQVLDVNVLSSDRSINFGEFTWKNIAIEFRERVLDALGSGGPNVNLQIDHQGTDGTASFVFSLDPTRSSSRIYFFKPGSTWQSLSDHDMKFQNNVWYDVRLEMRNSQINAYIDDQLVNQATDSRLIDGRSESLFAKFAHVQLDDIKVTDIGS